MKTNIILFPILVVFGIGIYIVMSLIPMYIYNSNTTGNLINNVDEIEMCNRLINKKFEILLYGKVNQLYDLYSNKYNTYIESFENSNEYIDLLDNFYTQNIDRVYKKIGNVYIVKYIINYLDNSSEEFTIIVKMNSSMKRAIIIYDSMFD